VLPAKNFNKDSKEPLEARNQGAIIWLSAPAFPVTPSLWFKSFMSDLAFNDPCIIFALRREAGAFLKEFRPQQRFPGAPCWARFCGPSWLTVLVLQTGIGPTPVEHALNWLLDEPRLESVPYRPKVILSAGFSGALTDSHRSGDVLLATEVVDLLGNAWPTTWPGGLPPGEWRPPLHRARLVTSARLIGEPREKRSLGARTEAAAVDMESAVLAALCSRRGVPFGCVRVILDELSTSLSPRLLGLLSDGGVSPWRVATALVGSPGLVRELWQLARQSRRVGELLGKALGELLTLTLPWTAD
jgi:nucleoside phosphorylase